MYAEHAEKPMVIVIPSYNNVQWYKKNLDSVFMQKYDNYRVIYIDDCSPDGTGKLVQQHIKECEQEHRVTLICNDINVGAMANIYNAVHDSCEDQAIVITLDGDDWFAHDKVLQKFNEAYQDPNIWLTHGQYKEVPSGSVGANIAVPRKIIELNAYREIPWITSAPRTFKAWLFKQIKKEDLLYKGEFFKVAWDLAFMFPMLEMAAERMRCISDVLYVYNQDTPINDYKLKLIAQLHCEKLIRSRPKYSRIKNLFNKHRELEQVDVLICADNEPMRVHATLESLYAYCTGMGEVHVLFPECDNSACIKRLKSSFAQLPIHFYTPQNFSACVDTLLDALPMNQVLCVRSGDVLVDFIDLKQCVQQLRETHAQVFNISLGANVVRHKALKRAQKMPAGSYVSDDVFAWQFKHGEFDWRNPLSLHMAIYNRSDLQKYIRTIEYSSVDELEQRLIQQCIDLEKVGLCFTRSKAVALQTGDEQDMHVSDWDTLYDIGFKFNLAPLFRINNESVCIESDMGLTDI